MALILSLSSKAQTGLVFSQCLTFNGDSYTGAGGIQYSPEYVVPEGKVWKIEYAYVDNNCANICNYLMVNNYTSVPLIANFHTFPVWVKSGDVIKIRSSSSTSDYFVTILEFNAN